MKRIIKNNPPKWFEDWKRNFEHANGRKAAYKKDFPQNEIRKLRGDLLREQGYICCYCMGRLHIDGSHVEHFRPKTRFPDEDMEYGNLLASSRGNLERTIADIERKIGILPGWSARLAQT